MSQTVRFRLSVAMLALLLLGVAPPHAAQDEKGKKKKEVPQGTPVLWRDPGDVSALDLFSGPGGESLKPAAPFTFVKEEKGGYSNVRFEARPEGVKRLDAWRWEQNHFTGTRELRGLKIMMALVENWDLKDDNNRVLAVSGASGTEMHHIVSDLGATIGKTGGQHGPIAFIRQIKGTRNEPEDYANDKFIEGVEGGRVRFNFSGKNSGLMRDITVEDARWLGGILSRLSDKQLEDAFRAANYAPEDVPVLAASVRGRINQLTSLAGGAAAPE